MRIDDTVDVQRSDRPRHTSYAPELTATERCVLAGLAAGLSTLGIATRLFISRQAVAYHVGNLLRKFGVDNRAGLVSKAFVAGVLTSDRWPPAIAACRELGPPPGCRARHRSRGLRLVGDNGPALPSQLGPALDARAMRCSPDMTELFPCYVAQVAGASAMMTGRSDQR